MADADFELVTNPAYEGAAPRVLKAACHDRTPFVTIRCGCGQEMHLHESQADRIPPDGEIAAACRSCGHVLTFTHGYFAAAFARLRIDGWIE